MWKGIIKAAAGQSTPLLARNRVLVVEEKIGCKYGN
jgi:hypothetical protein